jgi:hypothetical protein
VLLGAVAVVVQQLLLRQRLLLLLLAAPAPCSLTWAAAAAPAVAAVAAPAEPGQLQAALWHAMDDAGDVRVQSSHEQLLSVATARLSRAHNHYHRPSSTHGFAA